MPSLTTGVLVLMAPRRRDAGSLGGHSPQDHGLLAGGQALVVAGAAVGAAVRGDPGQGPFDGSAAPVICHRRRTVNLSTLAWIREDAPAPVHRGQE